jgi:hypothetical protein
MQSVGRVRLLALPLLLVALLAIGVGALQPAPAEAAKRATLKAKVGWGPLTSRQAAKKVTRTKWEPRRQNRKANRTVPTSKQLRYFRRNSDLPYKRHVNGKFRGTTDDIIEWAAYKWGLPENLLRAVAVHETWWVNSFVGDNGDSYGIFQMRRPYHCCLPFMRDSTAFNADYYGGIIRSYYDGEQDWLNHDGVREDNGRPYRACDLWGSVGAWSSGRWHIETNKIYVKVVKHHMKKRTWRTHEWFDDRWLDN